MTVAELIDTLNLEDDDDVEVVVFSEDLDSNVEIKAVWLSTNDKREVQLVVR